MTGYGCKHTTISCVVLSCNLLIFIVRLLGGYFMCYEYDPKYPDTTTTENNEGNPGANDDYGYDEHDNDKNDEEDDD